MFDIDSANTVQQRCIEDIYHITIPLILLNHVLHRLFFQLIAIAIPGTA
jgi:hypothetical protein